MTYNLQVKLDHLNYMSRLLIISKDARFIISKLDDHLERA